MFEYFAVSRVAASSAADPASRAAAATYESANGQMTVTFQISGFPASQGTRERPSGRFPWDRLRPSGLKWLFGSGRPNHSGRSTRSFLANKAVQSLRINLGPTMTFMWHAKSQAKPQTYSDSHCFVVKPQPTWRYWHCLKPVSTMWR